MDWKKFSEKKQWHSHANIFPIMGKLELASLAEDIQRNGLQEPIRLFEGKVLDGRNRAVACAKAGVVPRFVQWHKNGVSPLSFVIAENLHRRHLTTSQRAALAVMLLPQFAKEAKERQRAAGKHGVNGGRGHRKHEPLARKKAKGSGKATAHAAARLGLSASTVEKAANLARKQRSILRAMKDGKISLQRADKELNSRGKLHERFVAPPFTVLDARKHYWTQRKRFWHAAGVFGGHNEQTNGSQPKTDSFEDNSAFDPVLAECVYRWFCPPKGRVLDPCAGEAIKGLVAAKLGLDYTGIELRPKQVEENRALAKKLGVSPVWLQGNSTNMSRCVPGKPDFDLVFTSPPYFDTEIYSTDGNDSSAFKDYRQFLAWYEQVFRETVLRLKQNRFLVVKIGEGKRDEDGFFRNLVGESISCFLKLGLHYYNSAVLVTACGTAPMRVENQFPNYRKLVATHQNVLCFFKGADPAVIPKEFGLLNEHAYGTEGAE